MRAHSVLLGAALAFLAGCATTPDQTVALTDVIATTTASEDPADEPPAPELAEKLRQSGLQDLDREHTLVRKRGLQEFSAFALPAQLSRLPPKRTNDIRIHILPIGAGACQIVECPGASALPMLVDCGSSQNTPNWDFDESQVRDYLKNVLQNRRAIVVISHADKDHYRYIPTILAPNQVESLWMGDDHASYPEAVLTWANEVRALGSASRPRVAEQFPVNWHNQGSAVAGLSCGLANSYVLGVNNGTTKNDHSLMLSIDYGLFRAIFPGDATKRSQDAAIDNFPGDGLQATVLIASHHGASTEGSNNADWLAATQPANVVYSAGTPYQHPRCVAVERYRNGGTLEGATPHPLRCGDENNGWKATVQTDLGEYNTHNSGLIVITSGKNLEGLSIKCIPGPC